MHSKRIKFWELLQAAAMVWLAAGTAEALASAGSGSEASKEIRIVEVEGTVEVSTDGGKAWVRTSTNQLLAAQYRLRTGPNSRATLRWSDQSCIPVNALTELEILPPHEPQALAGLRLIKGVVSFFHRDKPGQLRVITRGAVAGVEGTEFVLAVDDREATTLSLIDGRVRFENEQATLLLTNGQQAIAELGRAPALTAGFVANNLLQWCFYYPGVLDLRDLPLTPEEEAALAASLAAYRAGDVLAALGNYPVDRVPASDAERVYRAALGLSVGQVDTAEDLLGVVAGGGGSERNARLVAALRQLISAVKFQFKPSALEPQLSTELLAASYYEQSRAIREVSLEKALDLAKQATVRSPDFGFARARVAELEFSFGRSGRALEALNRSLSLAPRNAQALALKGFLLAARNQPREAIPCFDNALAVDPGLGNAWLGRGLCRIRRGDLAGGREDLLVAAATEPRRALLRSYLGKADAELRDRRRASKELQLAKELDANDPTAWLYSALLNLQYNQNNQAVRDLEHSQELNDNRSVYRSSLLLDQDRAVRSANLAAAYRDVGMTDVSVREASRAVTYDYENYSAHLFLANSYNELRDPNRITLRYETPTEAEYLMANLLSPVGAGPLSRSISPQEYSALFQRDRLGVVSSTEYLSRGAWMEDGAQYGTLGNSAYSLEGFYRSDPGQRANNDFEERILTGRFKQQVTPQDMVYLQAAWYEASGGDLLQYYDPTLPFPLGPNLQLRNRETQDPTLSLGYRHEWAPGVQTLVLGSRLEDRVSVENPSQITLLVNRTPEGLDYVEPFLISQSYLSDLEIYSAELQQIWQRGGHTTVAGGRYQGGQFDTHNLQVGPFGTDYAGFITPDSETPAQQTNYVVCFERLSFYGYHQWQVLDPLWLVAGLSYDWIQFPANFRAAPISNDRKTVDQVSPKGGIIWAPAKNTVVRAAYTQSLSGASIDQSTQLEPTQVAGFLQSYRSIIPESIGGAEAGARFETFNASVEQKFPTGTYLALTAEWLHSEVDRNIGVFEFNFSGFATPGTTPDHLDYKQKSLLFTFNQLLGREWSLGVRYRVSKADLYDTWLEVLPIVDTEDPTLLKGFSREQHLEAILHEVNLLLLYNHPCGFFAQAEALWYGQSNEAFAFENAGDHFWQFNLVAGYRFPRRKAEISVGLLNVTDQDYRLNPLTYYQDLPRDRTLAARLRFNF